MLKLRIYGNPVPQGRPKFFRRGNFVGTYDPKKSKDWKCEIRWQAIENRVPMLHGALKMNLVFYLPKPKSLKKTVAHHTKRPDLDNLAKSVKDALKGICYKDDSQIVDMHAMKMYAPIDFRTGVAIDIEEYK